MNPQLLNNLGDAFSTFKGLVDLAQNPDKLDSMIAAINNAKDTLAKHAAAKEELAELETFKSTKQAQLDEIESAKAANEEAARLNTEHAKALTEASDLLESQKSDHQKKLDDHEEEKKRVKAREDAVADAEQKVKDAQAKVAAELEAAADLKKSYIAKLKTIAQAETGATRLEGASDGTSGS